MILENENITGSYCHWRSGLQAIKKTWRL